MGVTNTRFCSSKFYNTCVLKQFYPLMMIFVASRLTIESAICRHLAARLIFYKKPCCFGKPLWQTGLIKPPGFLNRQTNFWSTFNQEQNLLLLLRSTKLFSKYSRLAVIPQTLEYNRTASSWKITYYNSHKLSRNTPKIIEIGAIKFLAEIRAGWNQLKYPIII